MSGGFFRGTSAEQDTRFSNKQAKLLKSQKFAPELEHLVDMTKVKMDVIRPWIATKVTELLGFEDEVLINFIYGLLDGKEVNGKQVQISLTGFMEKNTGKFMKELWTLLLSAERNASGVPQQFLDAKEEETRKNKAESERIASEIQKKRDKDSREPEHERLRKMEDGDEQKAGDMELEPSSKNMPPKGSSGRSEDERSADQRNGVRRKRVSRSPRSIYRSPSPRGSHSRSVSRSYSNSRSYSGDKKKSRSVSRSPRPRRRSISSEKVRPSPRRRSLTPRSRRSPYSSRSPVRRRSSYSRRRSRSLSARRSPSPMRRRLRSPYRRRSRSPIRRRRSPSPIRHHNRSPLSNRRRRRSPSPVQGRRYTSPVRRSPSPGRRRFPSPRRRRSPLRVRRRSPSPSPVRQQHRRSSSPPRHSSSSLVQHRSPASSRRSISPSPGRSLSPSTSPSPVQHRFSSPVRRSTKEQRRSPGERQGMNRKSSPVGRMKSSDRDLVDRRDVGGKVPALSPSPNKSPVYKSPSRVRNRSTGEDRSPYESPVRPRREGIARVDSLSPVQKPRELKGQQDSKGTGRRNEASRSGRSPLVIKQRGSPRKDDTPERAGNQLDDKEFRKQDLQMKSKKSSGKRVDPGTPDRQRSPAFSEDSFQAEKQSAFCVSEGNKSEERVFSRQNHVEDGGQHHKAETSPMSYDNNHGLDSGSEGSERRTKHKEKRKHKRSERREVTSDDDSSYDSEIEGRKEAKRRRKEEKKLRKEEKRRRREERRRKKEGRRAEKLKMRGQDDDSSSDGGHGSRRKSHPSYDEVEETERKKLESELRKKALESLKAKKGISN